MKEKYLELENIFVCPISKERLIKSENSFICNSNGLNYEIVSGIPVFMTGKDTDSLKDYWDSGWKNRYSNDHLFHQKTADEYKKKCRTKSY